MKGGGLALLKSDFRAHNNQLSYTQITVFGLQQKHCVLLLFTNKLKVTKSSSIHLKIISYLGN
jgi:hypothetical protein